MEFVELDQESFAELSARADKAGMSPSAFVKAAIKNFQQGGIPPAETRKESATA